MWPSLVLWLSVAGLGSAVLCPDGTACDRGTSCCWLPGGQIGCCPLSQEVWHSMPMVPTGSWNDISVNLCPNKATCPSEYSCLQKSEGSYGCCPYAEEAVSCDDGRHCCPKGFQCSSDGKLCTKHSDISPVHAVICPDGESECPNESTCCKMPDQSWGCCPMPLATCCADQVHCCPHNSTCDLTHSRCISAEGEKPIWTKSAARKRAAWENALDGTPENVICGDGSTCPAGTTCCKMPDGKFGCCPIDQAVCCEDYVHCCPPNTECDLSHGKCTSKDGDSPLLIKSPALLSIVTKAGSLTEKDQDVQCDNTTFCPGSETCCRLPSGEWGCCPLEKAVCCSDHIHCCPSGTTCDTEHGSCTGNGRKLPWISHMQGAGEVQESQGVHCDATTLCSDRDTCCKSMSGGWACCPLPQAVCCADHLHCCPNGYTCSVEQGACLQGVQTIPWLTKNPAQVMEKKFHIQKVTCDDQATCEDRETCCKGPSGKWACCPIPQAVCCEDHLHCCPLGSTCNVEQQTCTQGSKSLPWLTKNPAFIAEVERSRVVPCDEIASCPDSSTCCKSASGEWSCCPLPSAVCCIDHIHCCPSGYTCDFEQGACLHGEKVVGMFTKTPAHIKEVLRSVDVPCNDTASCPDGSTCCRTASGEWGCCPIVKAVCCSDHIHCCPHGYTCNVEQETCLQGDNMVTMFKKGPAHVKEAPRGEDVPCDDTVSCPDGNTCCRTTSGEWGCCSILKAVCCSDHIHCCPNGYTCDVAEGTCLKGNNVVAMFIKGPAHVKEARRSEGVRCDDRVSCPEANTCCRLASGEWGCCPVEHAVCCSDHIHCCPYAYTCNVEQGRCLKGEIKVAMFTQSPAYKKEMLRGEDVPCDDTVSCPDGSTCCRTTSGDWGCCPSTDAVCCSDHIHCCPNGYTCNVEQGSCLQGDKVVAMFTKTPVPAKALPRSRDVPCNTTASCPDGSTCCRTTSGTWGCCPLVKAVCCSDHIHCCPNGFTCNVQEGSCLQGNTVLAMFKKGPVNIKDVLRSEDVPCDDTARCPDGNTCCRTVSGEWGCCPMVNAVCCDDHEHCCPSGYTCNTAQATCDKKDQSITWVAKRAALKTEVVQNSEGIRCDQSHVCPDGSTCCKTSTGSWSCCPLIQAVCCSDHIHCCPYGYTCDLVSQTCIGSNVSVPWSEKSAAHLKDAEEPRQGEMPCDESTSCPSDSTCCKSVSGEWACCPLLQAVCCTDGLHCCPSGYRCAGQSCVQEKGLRWDSGFFGRRKMKIL